MAASGVTVQDAVVTEFNNIKIGHQYQFIQMKLSPDNKVIEMDKTVPNSACSYEDFVHQLPADDCRYAVFDLRFDTPNSGQREQLIFIVWCPEGANIRKKMLYASSKDALKKKLVGISNEIQANDYADLSLKDIIEKVTCKMVK